MYCARMGYPIPAGRERVDGHPKGPSTTRAFIAVTHGDRRSGRDRPGSSYRSARRASGGHADASRGQRDVRMIPDRNETVARTGAVIRHDTDPLSASISRRAATSWRLKLRFRSCSFRAESCKCPNFSSDDSRFGATAPEDSSPETLSSETTGSLIARLRSRTSSLFSLSRSPFMPGLAPISFFGQLRKS